MTVEARRDEDQIGLVGAQRLRDDGVNEAAKLGVAARLGQREIDRLVQTLAAPSLLVTANLLALGLLCGAVGFLMYFRLIADTGATNALTVTYLIPPFGILWGMLFLGETLPPGALAGAVLILAGTVLVTRG